MKPLFETYEVKNWVMGHVPPTHISTSVASFPLIMFRGYKPATFAVHQIFNKFQQFGVEKVVLRGGVSLNPEYIPILYGGKSNFSLVGVKWNTKQTHFVTAIESYLEWLVDFVREYSSMIFAVELFNEWVWFDSTRRSLGVTHKSFQAYYHHIHKPLLFSEPSNVIITSFNESKKTLLYDNFIPAIQYHPTMPRRAEFPVYAIGEDYQYNGEVDQNALYHARA